MKCSCGKIMGKFESCKECSEILIKEQCQRCPWYLHDNDGVTIGPFEHGVDFCTFHHGDIDEMTKDYCHGYEIPRIPIKCNCCNDEKFEGVNELEKCQSCKGIICSHCYDCDSGECDTCRNK